MAPRLWHRTRLEQYPRLLTGKISGLPSVPDKSIEQAVNVLNKLIELF
jgi:hypothetical protein